MSRYIANNDTFIYLWHASTKIGGVCKSDNFYPWHVSTILWACLEMLHLLYQMIMIHLFIYDMHLQKSVMCVNLRIFILTCIFNVVTMWRYIANNDTFICGVGKSYIFYPWHVSTIFWPCEEMLHLLYQMIMIHLFIYDMHLQKLVMCVNLRIFIQTCISKFLTVWRYIANNDTFIYVWHASTKIGGVYR